MGGFHHRMVCEAAAQPGNARRGVQFAGDCGDFQFRRHAARHHGRHRDAPLPPALHAIPGADAGGDAGDIAGRVAAAVLPPDIGPDAGDVEKLRELGLPTDTWALIFEPEYLARLKGKVTVLNSRRELMAAAMKHLVQARRSM